jgi:hypothetical protein
MAQGVRAERFVDTGAQACRFHRARENGIVEVMAAHRAIQRIDCTLHRWKHELPAELARGAWILACQRIRQARRAKARGQVFGVNHARPLDLALQRLHQHAWQHRVPVFSAFALAHGDLVARKVEVFNPQTQALHQAHAGSI